MSETNPTRHIAAVAWLCFSLGMFLFSLAAAASKAKTGSWEGAEFFAFLAGVNLAAGWVQLLLLARIFGVRHV